MTTRKLLAAAGALVLGAAAALFAGPPAPVNIANEPTKEPAMSKDNQPAGPLDFKVNDIDGKPVDLKKYRGKVVMIVNVASRCGFTPQYKGLEALYKKYQSQGFVILGFPANNFNHQEPGSNEEIKTFCSSKYDVTFPMMAKISVAGDDQAPLYKWLTNKETASEFGMPIGWNFTKFLVDRNGNLIARWASQTKPEDPQVGREIEKAIDAKAAVASAK
jgi:glutathione peroxidase